MTSPGSFSSGDTSPGPCFSVAGIRASAGFCLSLGLPPLVCLSALPRTSGPRCSFLLSSWAPPWPGHPAPATEFAQLGLSAWGQRLGPHPTHEAAPPPLRPDTHPGPALLAARLPTHSA